MKRLLFSILLLIICISGCTIFELTLRRRTNELTESVNRCVYFSSQEDKKNALAYAAKTNELWEKSEQLFYMLLIHDSIRELDIGIPQLPILAQNDDMQEFYHVALECSQTLVLVTHSQRLTWGNVM